MTQETFNAWQLAIQAITVVLGIGLFVAAIWRDELKARLIKPKLRIRLEPTPQGEITTLRRRRRSYEDPEYYFSSDEDPNFFGDEEEDKDSQYESEGMDSTYASSYCSGAGRSNEVAAFYWHIELLNEKPWNVGKAVELRLLDLSITESESLVRRPLSGSLPMMQKGGVHCSDVGFKSVACGLVRLIDGHGLQARIAGKIPNNLRPELDSPGRMRLTLQAQGDNAVSNKLVLDVEWSGKFPRSDDASESVKITPREVWEE